MLRHSRVFRSFLISYVAILLIPCIGGYISYRTSISVTESISIENSVIQLEKSQELLEHRMAEVEGMTRQLAISQEINALMNDRGTERDVYGIWKAMRNVLTFGQTNDFLRNYFIYLANYNLIVTSGSSFRPEHYYEYFHYDNLSLEDWEQQVLGKTHRSEIKPLTPFTERDAKTSVITYMQSLPLDSFNDTSPAIVVVLIDQKTIAGLLSGLTEQSGGWVHIYDAEGNTIFLQGEMVPDIAKLHANPGFDENKTSQFYGHDLVITTRSDKNGWVYQAGIPRSMLMEKPNQIKQVSWMITGGAMGIGLLVGLFLAYRNSLPINRLISVMKEQFGKDEDTGRNEFDFLSGNIASMITKNKLLESDLHRQLPLVRDAFLRRLIAGEFESRDEIASAAAQADIALRQGEGYVGILQINGYAGMDTVEVLNELNAARLLMKQAVTELAGPVPMIDSGSDKIVLLFFSEANQLPGPAEEERITELMESLAQHVFAEYKISLQAGFGEPFASVMEVGQSFDQAKQALEYAVYLNRKGILWSHETQIENTTYYYPLDTEHRLISTIRAGELEEAQKIIDSIIAHNQDQRELSVEMKHQLVGEMKGTFLKLLDQKIFLESPLFESVKKRIIDIGFSEPLESIQQEFHAIMQELCGFIANKKKDSHAQLIKQIYQYTAEAYADPDLTLYKVAEQVERPEKYISQLFKEVTGVNYSDHLIKVRMDQAAVLLKESSYTVDEIAARVGYNSSHSFRRAFKRLTGISPSAYRQSCQD
ncbi:helix-turn-helix domain-containing protein [Paenibacillus rubinfantis]|uniref:helix-turn-helix domain-containing protein n=1 Tax=Paenibacillus rubinfantis TaxID=1720296 RepID=UPI00073E6D32|nr:helix-turn-helix domain-containing protein [Paenibacillus rubinfantis]